MEFESWMVITLSLMFLLAIGIFVYVSYRPSQKYGNTLKSVRLSTFDKVKKSGIGKLPSNAKKFAINLTKPKPEVKIKKEKEQPLTIPKPIEKNENPWHSASFFYEQEKTTAHPCGNYRLGDTWTDENGKEHFIQFNIEPGIWQGKKIFYLTYPHVPYEEEKATQSNGEPQYFH